MLRFEEPSDGCLLPAIVGGGAVVGGVVFAIALVEKHTVGMFAPLYGVSVYWMFTFCNRRTVVVDASGVRVTVGPVPNIGGQFIPRSQIAFCYASDTAASSDEGDVPDGTWFAIGVETRAGQRIHLYSRGADQGTALAAAAAVSSVFNANPAEPPIEARLVPARYDSPTLKREFVFWGVLAVAALALGVAWQWRQ